MRYQALANAIIVELNKLIADQTKENAYICAYHLVTLRSIAAAQENRDVCGGMPMLEGGDLAHRITDYFTDDNSLAKFYEYIKSHIIPNWGIILENPEVARPKRFVQGVLPNTLVTLSIEERVGQLIADLTALLKNLQGRELAALPTEVKYHVLCQIMWLGEAFDQLKKNAGKMDIRQALFQADAREAVLPTALIAARHAICHPRITDRQQTPTDVLDLTFHVVFDLLPNIAETSDPVLEIMTRWVTNQNSLLHLINANLTTALGTLEDERDHQTELEGDAAQVAEINQKAKCLSVINNFLTLILPMLNSRLEITGDRHVPIPSDAAAAARPINEVLTESISVRELTQATRHLEVSNNLETARDVLASVKELFDENMLNISNSLLASNDYSLLLAFLPVILEHVPVDCKNYDRSHLDGSLTLRRKLHPLRDAIATCSDVAYLTELFTLFRGHKPKRAILSEIDLLLLKDATKYLRITKWGDFIIAWYFLAHEYIPSESGETLTRKAFHEQIGLADFGFDNFLGLFRLILQRTQDPTKLFSRLGILTLLEHINDDGHAFWKILKEEFPKFKPLKVHGMADSEDVSLLLRTFSPELFEVLMTEDCNLAFYFEKLLSPKMELVGGEIDPTNDELKETGTFHLTFDAERFRASLDLIPAEKLAEISKSLLPQLVYLCLYHQDPTYMEKLAVLLSYPAVVTTGSMPNSDPLNPRNKICEFRNVDRLSISLLLLTLQSRTPEKFARLQAVVTAILQSPCGGARLLDCFNVVTPRLTTAGGKPSLISEVKVLKGIDNLYGANGSYGRHARITDFYQRKADEAKARETADRLEMKIANLNSNIAALEKTIDKKQRNGLFNQGATNSLKEMKTKKEALEARLAALKTPDTGKVPAAATAGLS